MASTYHRNTRLPNKRGQFYILSIVIIVATIVAFAVGILETSSSFVPQQTAFILNNLEAEAEQAAKVGKARGNLDAAFQNFVETTEYELAKEQISLKWDYKISGSQIDATLTLKSGTTTVTDSWTIS